MLAGDGCWRTHPAHVRLQAGELSRVRGKFSALLINDIDAGLGHFENTQVSWAREVWPWVFLAVWAFR
jgi:hypothetical protein